MQEAWLGDSLIKIKIENTESVNLLSSMGTPPGLIDTSVQALGLIKNITQTDEGVYVPLSIEKIIKYSDCNNSMWCIAKLSREHDNTIVGDVVFCDDSQQRKILEIKELSLVKADSDKLGKLDDSRNLLFNENWQLTDLNKLNIENDGLIIELRIGLNSPKIVITVYLKQEDDLHVIKKELTDYFDEKIIRILLLEYNLYSKYKVLIISNSEIYDISSLEADKLCQSTIEITKVYFSILKIIENLNLQGFKLCVITQNLYDIENNGLTRNYISSVIWGLFKSVELESTDLDLTLLDIDETWQKNVSGIFACTCSDGTHFCIREKKIYLSVIQNCICNAVQNKDNFNPEKLFVVFGGLGALGFETCKWLISNNVTRLLIIGKSSIEEKQKVIDQLISLNKHLTCRYFQLDITADNAYAELTQLLKGENMIGGIYYSIGSVVDKHHLNYLEEDISKVYLPKIKGTFILSEVLSEIKFDYCVCYSSIVSSMGAAGQSIYGAANSFQDYICKYMQSNGYNMFTVQWGPWEKTGMFTKVSKIGVERYTKRNIHTLSADQALRGLKIALSNNKNIMISNMSIDNKENLKRKKLTLSAENAIDRSDLFVMSKLKELIAAEIGVKDFSLVDENSFLLDLGIDSLMLVELRIKINNFFNVNLPLDMFFNDLSISTLAKKINFSG